MNLFGLVEIRRTRSVPPSHRTPPPAATELIELADRVESDSADTLDRVWLREQLRAVLALHEVAPIADRGPIDFTRHEVVADRPTGEPRQVDHIADTVRPGYLWRGTVLRAQQVVAWTDPS